MTDISVIILVGKEELHIARCLEKLKDLAPRQIFVVESQKGDRTHEIAITTAHSLGWNVEPPVPEYPPSRRLACEASRKSGAPPPHGAGQHNQTDPSTVDLRPRPRPSLSLVWHTWPGLQSTQFNWALDNLPLEGEWILRLDADEYLTPVTMAKLSLELSRLPKDVSGLTLELKRRFCGGEIRHATVGIRQVRLFRRGKARYEETQMDERLRVDGEVADFDGAFYDDNLNDMDWWREKHRGYAKREALQALESMKTGIWTDPRKAKYYRFPPYVRALLYFAIRYILKGGILDGYAGWQWNFWQGLWYRWKCDQEITHATN